MNTKNILKTLALAMLLVSACNKNEIANDENTDKKGFALPVTVNVTREGDDATKATYNESTRKLEFSAGDKLFVKSKSFHAVAGQFAGTLDYDAVSGKFSGTVTTQKQYTGTIDGLMASAYAFLLPAGYESYGFYSVGNGYNATITYDDTKAFALTKKEAVEQFSFESVDEYNNGFALAPMKAIASFTISGLTANKEVAVSFNASGTVISGNVTTSAEGVATFAVGVSPGRKLENCTLTVDGNNIAMPTKTTVAGHIYNISRSVPSVPDGALIGQFSVSDTKKVYFSKGNLQYTKSTGKWSFMTNQYSTVETHNQSVGTNYASQNVVSLFGWGTSGSAPSGQTARASYYTNADNTDYVSNITTTGVSWGTGSEWDWGTAAASDLGSGWRTLTKDEWVYLFNTRTVNNGQGSGKSYTLGQTVNDVLGVVLYPDDYTGTTYTTSSDWSTFESAGCVFLPAAGYRSGPYVYDVGSSGNYWSSTASSASNAYYVRFISGTVNPANNSSRYRGYSVRLVRPVTE